jgi:hypothetical protein
MTIEKKWSGTNINYSDLQSGPRDHAGPLAISGPFQASPLVNSTEGGPGPLLEIDLQRSLPSVVPDPAALRAGPREGPDPTATGPYAPKIINNPQDRAFTKGSEVTAG